MFGPMRSRLLAAFVIASVALAACGSGADGGDGQADVQASGSDRELAVDLLSGVSTTLDGSTFDLGDVAGQDVILWFWAPW